MAEPIIYTLKIENTSPSVAPMQWVADYISEFAKMLGCKDHVHLSNVRDNCIALDAAISPQYTKSVRDNVQSYRADNRAAYNRFDRLLRKHGHYAVLYDQNGVVQTEIPGIKTPEEQPLSIKQNSSIQGTLVWIGGESNLSVAHLSLGDGKTQKCHLPRGMAKKISQHLYETFIFEGTSNWVRDKEGKWSIEDYLHVQSYELLPDESLNESLNRMRQVMGDWSQSDDVESIVDRIRKGF